MGLGRDLTKESDVRTFFARWPALTVDWWDVARVIIDMLPDDVLLAIFDFYLDKKAHIDAWHKLVHVCRTWRNIVFGSPSRLNLRLYCKSTTRVWKTLDIWPRLPIAIRIFNIQIYNIEIVLSGLGHTDLINELQFWRVPSDQLKELVGAMRRPYPALADLTLEPGDEKVLTIPDSFLGGSAPRLRSLNLYHIRFRGLPNLLLSATHLVHLQLVGIPHSGYISPDTMVSCLSVLTKLEKLTIGFASPRSRPDRKSQRPPPQTRALLPVLTDLHFRGICEYLEDLVAWIDAPLLDDLEIKFFHQATFDTPQLTVFLSRTPKFQEARVVFSDKRFSVTLPQTCDGKLELEILSDIWR